MKTKLLIAAAIIGWVGVAAAEANIVYAQFVGLGRLATSFFPPCNAARESLVGYDKTQKKLVFCDSTAWVVLGGDAGPSLAGEPFITYAASSSLTAESVLTNGSNTTIARDGGFVQVDVSIPSVESGGNMPHYTMGTQGGSTFDGRGWTLGVPVGGQAYTSVGFPLGLSVGNGTGTLVVDTDGYWTRITGPANNTGARLKCTSCNTLQSANPTMWFRFRLGGLIGAASCSPIADGYRNKISIEDGTAGTPVSPYAIDQLVTQITTKQSNNSSTHEVGFYTLDNCSGCGADEFYAILYKNNASRQGFCTGITASLSYTYIAKISLFTSGGNNAVTMTLYESTSTNGSYTQVYTRTWIDATAQDGQDIVPAYGSNKIGPSAWAERSSSAVIDLGRITWTSR